jgi:apolipoprotein N-acyltransferase
VKPALTARWAPRFGALGAGLLVAASLPPWGWWPLAFAGLATWARLLDGTSRAERFKRTWWFSVGWLAPATAWMWFLTAPGYVVAVSLFGGFHALAVLAVPQRAPGSPGPDPWRWLTLPAALTAAEALRFSFPFGGVPLASLAISQVAGPLGPVARIGGAIGLTFVTAFIGTNLGAVVAFVRRQPPPRGREAVGPVAAITAVVGVILVALVAPSGKGTGATVDVTFVQGGGEQGTRAIDTDSRLVVERHLSATRTFAGPTGIVVWPENVIDVADFATSVEREEVAAEAARLGVPFLVGITEDTGDRQRFLNAQVVVQPDGSVTSRYDKVRRVPFGEYMPLRGLLDALGAPTDAVPRDAVAGTGPAVVTTPFGEFGVVISWEVFFGGRAREAVRHDALVLVNPTNGSSYTGTILQTQQVASSRLRALETGRWVVQVSPTGFSAFVSPSGVVYDRTAQREAAVRTRAVELRSGQTWYVAMGDAPIIVLVIGAWSVPLWWPCARRGAQRVTRRSRA